MKYYMKDAELLQ